MDAQQLLAEFGHIANASNGVLQMRELVLVLAMQGRLAPQSSVATAVELLEQVGEEKRKLTKAGVIRSPKPLPELGRNDAHHSIPANWTWVRFGEIALHNSGKTLDSSRNRGSPRDYITTSNLYWGRFDLSSVKQMLIREEELEKCTARKNDLLICEGGEAGRAAVWTTDNEVCFQNHVHRARFFCGINPFFAYRFFEKLNATGEINAHRKGIGISNMSSRALAMIPFPLPPLEEQSRIVAKVDELMALCDKLEAQQQARRKLQNNLRQSTLQAVASATSPHELQNAWARLTDNFGRLFHVPGDVAELRNLILDLAANGFVSEPQTDDGDPLALLSQASLQQKTEFSVRELREINALPEPTYENGRVWIALGRIVKLVSGQHLSPDEYNTRQDGIPYITGPAEFKDRRPSPSKWTHERRAVARAGDVLITVKGSGVGKTALCDLEELAISRQLMAIRALADLDRSYLSICIDSAERRFQEQKFGIAIPGIGRDEVLGLTVLLPSIEEQGRIVNRVDELMRLCDSLELQLRNSQKVSGRLAIAATSSLTGIAIKQDEESMKAPQTELVATLRLGTAPDIKTQAPLATILARHNGEMAAKDLWQRFGGEIDAFYAQLKTEVAHGWILEPAVAEMREKQPDTVSA